MVYNLEFSDNWQSGYTKLRYLEIPEEKKENYNQVIELFDSESLYDWKIAFELLAKDELLDDLTFIRSGKRAESENYLLKHRFSDIEKIKNFSHQWHNVSENIIHLKSLKRFMNLYGFFEKEDFDILGEVQSLELFCLSGEAGHDFFPIGLTKLSNLKELYLPYKHGQMREIPDEIANLKNLEVLSLSDHILDGRISPEIKHLKKLRILDLSVSCITDLPKELAELENLELLDLSFLQELEKFPEVIYELKNLKYLYFDSAELDLTEKMIEDIKKALPNLLWIKDGKYH